MTNGDLLTIFTIIRCRTKKTNIDIIKHYESRTCANYLAKLFSSWSKFLINPLKKKKKNIGTYSSPEKNSCFYSELTRLQ